MEKPAVDMLVCAETNFTCRPHLYKILLFNNKESNWLYAGCTAVSKRKFSLTKGKTRVNQFYIMNILKEQMRKWENILKNVCSIGRGMCIKCCFYWNKTKWKQNEIYFPGDKMISIRSELWHGGNNSSVNEGCSYQEGQTDLRNKQMSLHPPAIRY